MVNDGLTAELGGYMAVSYLAEHVFADTLEALTRTEWGTPTP